MVTQQIKLLQALREGSVNSYFATFNMRIKQAPTRIRELKLQGHEITSTKLPDRSVNWELTQEYIKPITQYEFIGNTAVLKS